MDYKYTEFKFTSVVKTEKIFTRLYEPVGEAKAVLQIVHGMAEHSALYGDFCDFLASDGYIVAIDDHLGHGRSVSSGEDYGYFFDGGINNLIEDEKALHDIISKKYSSLPYFIMGHSMGSFITREFVARYGNDLCGAIIMGTAGGMRRGAWLAQKIALNALIAQRGPKAKVKRISDMATASYVRAFPGSPNDWVCSDPKEVDRYTKDPMCGFQMTVSAYKSIGELINKINSKEWYQRVPKKLPILMISGAKDPVGGMGTGVRHVASNLVKTEHDVDLIMYPNIRHALITEVNKDTVFTDIRNFMEYKILRAKRDNARAKTETVTATETETETEN